MGPVGLDKNWVATSAQLESVGESQVWRVGVVTPSTEYISVIVSKSEAKKLLKTYVDIESEVETTRVIGNKNYKVREDENNKALYILENQITTLVYSTADWDEITKFVENLKVPQL